MGDNTRSETLFQLQRRVMLWSMAVERQEVEEPTPALADGECPCKEGSEDSTETTDEGRGSSDEEAEDTPPSSTGDGDDENIDTFADASSSSSEEGELEECPLVRTRPGYVYDKKIGRERKRIMMDDFVEERHRRLLERRYGKELEIEAPTEVENSEDSEMEE
jgi:succinate dehydrogenase/fumarate reductase flavoprotein subunit